MSVSADINSLDTVHADKDNKTGSNPISIMVGGKAGEGVKKASTEIARICAQMGRYIFQTDDYQSLIRGGHNFSTVTTDTQPVYSVYDNADIIICFDDHSYQEHHNQLKPNGFLVYNSDETKSERGIGIPLHQLVKDIYGAESNPSVSAVAIFAAICGIPKEQTRDIVTRQYKRDAEKNAQFAEKVYDAIVQGLNRKLELTKGEYKNGLFTGNQLIFLGAYAAGLDMYYSYPMTPTSSLLTYAAAMKNKLSFYAVHPESELAAINLAIGSAIAGCRSAVGSSGGGFALMQEAFSLCGMAEVPLLCVLSSRPGPATGLATYHAQEDLGFALHQGHGEFPRVVASPDNMERAFTLAAEMLSIAWKFQIPVILLTEKHLSESMMNVSVNPENTLYAEPVYADTSQEYQRYRIVNDQTGVSPMAFPPSAGTIKWHSNEHLQSGLISDFAPDVILMKQKRHRKYAEIRTHVSQLQTVAEYGEGEQLIFAYGSTALSVREAMKYISKPVKLIAVIYLEPFPMDKLAAYRDKPAVVVEHSIEGTFASLLQSKLNIQTEIIKDGNTRSTSIRKYDGRTFDPLLLAKQIEEVLS